MADREKVIKALENGIATAKAVEGDFVYITKGEARIAVELLKEQEAVDPQYEMIYGDKVAFCGNCDTYLGGGMKYCPKCGKAVKWDE